MLKSLLAAGLIFGLFASAEACNVTINPQTGEITGVPQNATPFAGNNLGAEVARLRGGGGGGVPRLPEIQRGAVPRQNVRLLTGTYTHMLDALDPDLKKPDGKEMDPYEKTFRFQGKLSEASEVMHALDVAARLDALEVGQEVEKPTDEEVQHAEAVLTQAVKDLADDVPDAVRAEVMYDPRKIWMLWIGGAIAFAIGCVVLYWQKQRQMAAAM